VRNALTGLGEESRLCTLFSFDFPSLIKFSLERFEIWKYVNVQLTDEFRNFY